MVEIQAWANRVIENIETVFYGKEQVIRKILSALLSQGHVLLDDVPGLGKTILARSLSISIGARLSRIQATPDLMPSDVLGVSVYNPSDGTFKYRKGPLLANLVLVDEINRATPRTQSALLEAMAEGQVSIEGKSLALPAPFFLIATQNPVDFEGTFPLPEAQKDRFLLTLSIGYPERSVEKEILKHHATTHTPLQDLKEVSTLDEVLKFQTEVSKVHVAEAISDYIITLGESTRQNQNLRMGISPRGTLALYRCSQAFAAIQGRSFVTPEDVKDLVVPVFLSRILLKPSASVKGLTPQQILSGIVEEIPAPHMSEVHKG